MVKFFFSGFWIRGQIGGETPDIEGPLLLASRQEGVTNSQEEAKQTKEIILEPIAEEDATTTMLNSSDYQTESYQLEDLFSQKLAATTAAAAENSPNHDADQ